jgi:hypothetical protein
MLVDRYKLVAYNWHEAILIYKTNTVIINFTNQIYKI